jgi:hypothetical protein
METPDLVQFIKDTKGSHSWTVSSVIRVAVALYLKVQLFTNLSKEQKTALVCNLLKKVLEEEKAELDKKLGATEAAVFEKVLVAVDEVLPSVLEHIPVPELPKAITRWFSFIPCSSISVGLQASEHLVSLANLKKEKVSEVAVVAAVVAPVAAVVAEVAVVVAEQSEPQAVAETKPEVPQPEENKV